VRAAPREWDDVVDVDLAGVASLSAEMTGASVSFDDLSSVEPFDGWGVHLGCSTSVSASLLASLDRLVVAPQLEVSGADGFGEAFGVGDGLAEDDLLLLEHPPLADVVLDVRLAWVH
jgi:hypothetical protein